MRLYLNAFVVEILKLRRTLALWCILIAPAVMTILAISLLWGRSPGDFGPGFDAWGSILNNGFNLWAIMVLPLYISLQSTLLAQLEHGNQQWKYLYALPVPRFAYFTAKWAVVTLVVVATHVLLVLGLAAGGKFTAFFRPGWGLETGIPWGEMLHAAVVMTLAGMLVLAIQLLVSLRWRSFIPSLGLGVVAVMANFFVMSSDKVQLYDLWLYPILALRGEGNTAQIVVGLGLGLGLVLALAGGWFLTRMQVK